MNRGRLVGAGTPADVIAQYQQTGDRLLRGRHRGRASVTSAAGAAQVQNVYFRDERGHRGPGHDDRRPARARSSTSTSSTAIHDAVVEVFYYSRDGRTLHCQQSTAVQRRDRRAAAGPPPASSSSCDAVRAAAGHLRRRRVDPRAPRLRRHRLVVRHADALRRTGQIDARVFLRAARMEVGRCAQPKLSIILPTYNRAAVADAARSRRCCARPRDPASLRNRRRRQQLAATAPRTLVAAIDDPRVRVVREPRQGLSYARNAGLEAARAPIVAFTDDDVEVGARLGRDDRCRARTSPGGGRRRRPRAAGLGARPRPRWLTREHWAPLALQDHGDCRRVFDRDARRSA